MQPPKSVLRQRIAQELSLLDDSDKAHLSDDCPERAWMNGAAWMAEKIAQLIEDESDEAATLLKKTSLAPVCLRQAGEALTDKAAQT